jgi:hypothetical protein
MVEIAGMHFEDLFLRHNNSLLAIQYTRYYWFFLDFVHRRYDKEYDVSETGSVSDPVSETLCSLK